MARGLIAPEPEADWQAEQDHRTLMDAAKVQASPKRMTGVRKQHKKITKGLSLVQQKMLQSPR
jgi:hypothetical protein